VTGAACWHGAQRHDAAGAGAGAVAGPDGDGSMQERYPVPHAVAFAGLAMLLDLQTNSISLMSDVAQKQSCCGLLPKNIREIKVLPPTHTGVDDCPIKSPIQLHVSC
jgi:hypothetical protein